MDGDRFCREVCKVALFERREKIGGPGKLVQIDESKIGKRNYHRGHVVLRDSGYSEDSRKCFIVTVGDRSEKYLVGNNKRMY